jgi:hypothetical protein
MTAIRSVSRGSRLTILLAMLGVAMLSVGLTSAYAKGGTAKPPPRAVAPFVEPTLANPTFSVDPAKIHGFDSTGHIQNAVVSTDDKACPGTPKSNWGGSVTMNNTTTIVPCNLTIQMPANTFLWADFVNGGLDLTLNGAKPSPAFEVRVVGNLVDTKRIAALMYFSQQSVNSGEGYITAINYTDGSLTLDSGAKVQINDPKIPGLGGTPAGTGRFSAGQSPDPRLSVDQGNPTILAATDYPMCVPRTDPATADPLCPQQNRPLTAAPGGCRNFSVAGVAPPRSGELSPPAAEQVYCSQYVMPAPPAPGVTTTGPDARQQVPFEVGDHVTYAGTLVADPAGCNSPTAVCYISAHTVNADIGVYTQPGFKPAYSAIEAMGIGTADPLLVAVNGARQETQDRMVMVAMTTDVNTPADIYIEDINPADGSVRSRWVTPFEMTGENQAGTPSGGITTQNAGPQAQRIRLRATKAPSGLLSNPARTIRVASRTTCTPNAPVGNNKSDANPTSSANATTAVDNCFNALPPLANGLQAGQYTAPMFDFIFPENVQPGAPIVPNDFWHLGFLRYGEGANPITPTVGPLTPAPW